MLFVIRSLVLIILFRYLFVTRFVLLFVISSLCARY